GELLIFNISNPNNISQLAGGFFETDEPLDIAVAEDRAFLLLSTFDGPVLQIWNVGNTPRRLISTTDLAGWPVALAVSGNAVYLLDDEANELKIFDASSPSNLNLIGSFPVGNNPTAIKLIDQIAYVVDGEDASSLLAIDVSDVANPSLVAAVQVNAAQDLDVVDSTAVIVGSTFRVVSLECSLPANLPASYPVSVDRNSGSFIISEATSVDSFALNGSALELALSSNPALESVDLLPLFGTIDPGTESTAQNTSNQAGNGFITTPWVYTNAMEAPGERGPTSTLITLGDDGTYGEADEIHLVTNGENRVEVTEDGDVAIMGNLSIGGELTTTTAKFTNLEANTGKIGTIDLGAESTDQNASNQAGNGFMTTPWVYTNAMEAPGERGPASTLVTIGNDGTYGSDDEIHLVTNGESGLVVASNGQIGVGTDDPQATLDLHGADDNTKGRIIVRRGSRNSYLALAGPGNAPYHSAIEVAQFSTGTTTTAIAISNENDGSFGYVGIGRVPMTYRLEVEGQASKTFPGSWSGNSDARLKKNITALNPESTLEKLLALQGITYEWDDDQTGYARPTGPQYGFTAQNIQEVFPTLVEEDAQGYLQTAYGTYDAMYVEAFRAQQRQIDALRAENQQLQQQVARIQAVEATLASLQQQLSSLDHSTTNDK
ncbi:MAG: tail fiber domain-containing protein, partial [Bacteroidota bacterium]